MNRGTPDNPSFLGCDGFEGLCQGLGEPPRPLSSAGGAPVQGACVGTHFGESEGCVFGGDDVGHRPWYTERGPSPAVANLMVGVMG